MLDGFMKVSKRSKRISICLALLPCLLSCSQNSSVPEHKEPITSAHGKSIDECGFRASGFAGKACKVPFIAVLANAEEYLGKRVFTYAYMIGEADGRKFTFLAEPRVRSSPDLASCALMEQQAAEDDRDLSNLIPGAIYSVSFAGTFTASKNYVCTGVFEDVDFQDIALEVPPIKKGGGISP